MAGPIVTVRRRAHVAGAALAFGLLAGPALAADPSGSPRPSPSEEPGGAFPEIQIWQDEALPPDLPEGRSVDVGFTAWDATGETLFRVGGAQVRVHPKTGKAKPIEAFTRSDWQGHLVAPITVPKGGLGTIEVGFTAQECHDDTGTCSDVFQPFAWGGVGPPPDASRALVVEASIDPPAEPLIAGQPFDVIADVTPRAAWGADELALPTQLVVVARAVRESEYSLADLNRTEHGQYIGSIEIPRVGDVVLIVGFPMAPTRTSWTGRSCASRSKVRTRTSDRRHRRSRRRRPSRPVTRSRSSRWRSSSWSRSLAGSSSGGR